MDARELVCALNAVGLVLYDLRAECSSRLLYR
jgi:hypothetical protein